MSRRAHGIPSCEVQPPAAAVTRPHSEHMPYDLLDRVVEAARRCDIPIRKPSADPALVDLPWGCASCGERFPTINAVGKHWWIAHTLRSERVLPPEYGAHKCQCGKLLGSYQAERHHRQAKHGDAP